MEYLESLRNIGIKPSKEVYWNLSMAQLVSQTLKRNQGIITSSGALACDTGEFTGRSPKDKYIVLDDKTKDSIWWGEVNHPFSPEDFDSLYDSIINHLSDRDIYVRDVYACAKPEYRLNIRVITETAWSNLFVNNLFLRPNEKELETFDHEWLILNAPEFKAVPELHKTRQHNFTIINFTKKIILIGGSGYTGEIKKGIFTVLNYILPFEKKVLSMHCSANVGMNSDTSVFFGLSGTGKTTLSADPSRKLIGDDEHGWDDESVFNFEGGCYAKCVNLSEEKEPQIFSAIRTGTLLENVRFFEGTDIVDYDNVSVTENTRAAYPINFIDNTMHSSIGKAPNNIFFLTCDAFGVLPPISKLSPGQAMYHFISGYTAKVAGTEAGVTEPQTTFSACFGKPFLPLHPTHYAELLGKKLKENNVTVWLINTGWSGGPYGTGKRINLQYTRAMISAVLENKLENVDFITDTVFGLQMPIECEGVPSEILNPKNTWDSQSAYDEKAQHLAEQFAQNFESFEAFTSQEILSGGPSTQIK
ncbi:phosphoenolpyruvate carboxykinase (ATP) [Chryseobacterium sp. Ch-15]|uniref:Phosphoenolpyruvate carboxykinase (ATP) n=1 Tax=Chryseobacterium muglaense TaxID=2893752 RepID=A0A9Q3V1I2_9FLAO|nr:phosphoenolpyruvate carboxykinase (ATP) [Chryseobacterium muglaense]MBD3906443.1 phosphoenolpyruvate carboxykinase (ATP) [Chryseobacterium muglaense]MCC9036845.1 phosphoenolpyruvate carboxykinase (ATP) [Chryseobacterium muglaense]MCM2556171.1 phosphoenolpyruvate carboxykinase (ATP) [Chryseobacterium muglaense]